MAYIPCRKPYFIEQNTTDLQVRTKTYAVIDPGWQHTIQKGSYSGSAEDLKVDVSPFIRPYFYLEPQATPSNIGGVPAGQFPNVVLEVNTVEESHRAVYGYVEPVDASYWDHWQVTKSIASNTDSYITLPPGIYTVNWATSDGQVASETTISLSTPNVVRVAHTGLDLTTANTLTISANGYDYKYNINCPYQDGTIGFINAIGQWEYFDVLGRQDYTQNREADDYIPFSVGETRMFNVTGSRGLRVSTGWVDQEWGRRILPELMVSPRIVWHKGTSWDELILDTNTQREQRVRTDKMMNYTFAFTYAAPVISIV